MNEQGIIKKERKATADLYLKQAAKIERLESLLADAKKRLQPFADYWKNEVDIETAITLDDCALADAWIDMYEEMKKS